MKILFANIFFLFLFLFLIANAAGVDPSPINPESSFQVFTLRMILYVVFIFFIYYQSRLLSFLRIKKDVFLLFLHIELIAYFFIFFFLLNAQRIFFDIKFAPFQQSLLTIFSFCLYFFGLFAFFYQKEKSLNTKHLTKKNIWKPIQFLIPFAMPFLIFVIASDAWTLIPLKEFSLLLFGREIPFFEDALNAIFTAVLLIALLLFFPPLLIFMWQCPPLDEGELNKKLEEVCRKAHFKHGGFKKWTVLDNVLTAAIIGVFGCFRYPFLRKAS